MFFDDDYLKTGDRYADKINEFIKECDYFVDGDWINVARREQYIRPYLIDDTSPMNDRIPNKMRSLDINKIDSVDDMGSMVREFIRENNLTTM